MELITTHTGADFDTLGAMIAAKKLYPKAEVAFSGSLEDTLRVAVEKTTLPLEIKDARDIDLSRITRLILVDINRPERIGRFGELLGRKDVEVHIYDHHPQIKGSTIKADLNVHEDYGSTTTILTLILKEKNIALTSEEATLLMAAIYEDTGSLSFPSTRKEDLEAASLLLEAGADLSLVSELITKPLSTSEVFALESLIRSERLYTIGGINVVIAKISLEGYKGDVSTLAQRMMEMEHIDALVLLAETPDRVHLVIRSSAGSLNAGALARKLGGGGHIHAASATLKAMTLIEADEEVIQALKKVITPKVTASDIMSSPAITTLKGKTIESALELMRRYNINALAVTSKKKPIGVITRQVVDKALHHGLKGELVSELMNPGRLIVKTSTSTDEVRDIVMTHGQRILSVIDDKSGDLAGIITRTDLLKLLREGLREKETTSDITRQSKRKKKIASFMKEKLPAWTLNLLKDIGETADSLGFEAYAVGGFVRDILLMLEDTSGGAGKMDRKDLDIDVVIEGDAVRFAKCFAKKNSLHVKSHLRFKSSTIKFPNGFKLDVATARLEYYDHPGALPNVAHSSLKLDLYRRDFTINTLAMALNPNEFAEVIDFFGARDDIKRRKIRILHNLSFVEDPIRVLRAIRFSERFGFDISPHTLKLIKNSIRLNLLRKSSGPRILDELKNIMNEDSFEGIIVKLGKLGILQLINPKITVKVSTRRLLRDAKDTLAWYRLSSLNDKSEAWLTLFLALTDTLTNNELLSTIKRLGLSGKRRLQVIRLRRDGLRALSRLEGLSVASKAATIKSKVYTLLKGLPTELTLYLMAKTTEKKVKDYISTHMTKLKNLCPLLTGKDLKSMGIKEGPVMGKILAALLKGRLDGRFTTREDEVKFVKTSLKGK